MRRYIVCTVLQYLEQLMPDIPGLLVTGANFLIANTYSNLLRSPEVEALEIFLPPAEYERREIIAAIAQAILPPERRGKGSLRFYPIHFADQIWADGEPRVMLTPDAIWMSRDRYVRDMFATGPMAISCQVHGYGNYEFYRLLAPVATGYSCKFDSIVSISEACQEAMRYLLSGYLAPQGSPLPCRLDVVHNPVDIQKFHLYSEDQKRAARTKLGIAQDACVTLYFGRLTPNSKADLLPLLRAFAKESGDNDVLVIAGEENSVGYGAMLQAQGEAMGLKDRLFVRTPVPSEDRIDYYGVSDIFAFPCDNVQECLANTVLEAMAVGLPVLVSDWDGPRDTVVDGVTGYKVPTYLMPGLETVENYSPASSFTANMLLTSQSVWIDSRIFAERLGTLLRSPDLRKQFGAAGRKRMEDEFTWPSISARLFAIWDELLDAANSEPATEKALRKEGARALGKPIPFRDMHRCYATASVTESDEVRLTDRGASIIEGATTLAFYDECLPLIRPEAVQALLAFFANSGAKWVSLGSMADEVEAACPVSRDSILLHTALLLKQDAIEIQVPIR